MQITRPAFAAALVAAAFVGFSSTPAQAAPVQEDDPAWSCVSDGDHVCGPENSNGVPPGLYDAGGVLVSPWPTVTTCEHPPTLPDLLLGTAHCRSEFISPSLVRITGGLR